MTIETTLSLLQEAETIKNHSAMGKTALEQQEKNNALIYLYGKAIEFYCYESRTEKQKSSVTLKIFDGIAHLKSLLNESSYDTIGKKGIKKIKEALKWTLKLTYNNEDCSQETHRELARFFQQKEQPTLALIHFYHACISNENGSLMFNNSDEDYHLYYHALTSTGLSDLQSLLQHQPPIASDHLLTSSLKDEIHSQIARHHCALANQFEANNQPAKAFAHWRLARDYCLSKTTHNKADQRITDIIKEKLKSSTPTAIKDATDYYRTIKNNAGTETPSHAVAAPISSQKRPSFQTSANKSTTQTDLRAPTTVTTATNF